MDKTININLGGVLFSIDEAAYRILQDYLSSLDRRLRNMEGGAETLEDIESRIAEIFQSQKGLAGVISVENVNAMISIIGNPEDIGRDFSDSRPTEDASARKRLYRNPDDRIIAGVASGIGINLNTDPVWIRLIFIITAFIGGLGFFVYVALWIALPMASDEHMLREMYGIGYNASLNKARRRVKNAGVSSGAGHAINQVLRAVGKVIFIFFRIIFIATGIAFLIFGFMILVTFVMIFLFGFPGSFSTEIDSMNIGYIPDFLNYVITPNLVPWIKVLISAVVIIPLMAIIYGGIRLIFWFRVRDGFVWLTGLILWVASVSVLSVMMFSEGVSFAETGKTTNREFFTEKHDTLFLVTGKKLGDLQIDNEITIPDEEYCVYISDEKKEVYIKTYIDIVPAENDNGGVTVRKRSLGRTRIDASEKAEGLLYGCEIRGDSVILDEYFQIPPETKWSFDNVRATVQVPAGTIIHIDRTTEKMFRSGYDGETIYESGKRFWKMTDSGLVLSEYSPNNKK